MSGRVGSLLKFVVGVSGVAAFTGVIYFAVTYKPQTLAEQIKNAAINANQTAQVVDIALTGGVSRTAPANQTPEQRKEEQQDFNAYLKTLNKEQQKQATLIHVFSKQNFDDSGKRWRDAPNKHSAYFTEYVWFFPQSIVDNINNNSVGHDTHDVRNHFEKLWNNYVNGLGVPPGIVINGPKGYGMYMTQAWVDDLPSMPGIFSDIPGEGKWTPIQKYMVEPGAVKKEVSLEFHDYWDRDQHLWAHFFPTFHPNLTAKEFNSVEKKEYSYTFQEYQDSQFGGLGKYLPNFT
jgi:hypothetical protein